MVEVLKVNFLSITCSFKALASCAGYWYTDKTGSSGALALIEVKILLCPPRRTQKIATNSGKSS
jgi:hypothetical protein